VQPVAGRPLTFVTQGIGRPGEVTLVPLHQIVEENYTVYFRLYDETGWEKFYAAAGPKEARRQAAAARIVDAVWAGNARNEAAHGVEARNAPLISSRMSLFRDATQGSVTWKLQAAAGEPMTLRVGYVDAASAAFEVVVGDQKIAEERPPPTITGKSRAEASGGRSVTTLRNFPVPAAATAGKPVVEVRFNGRAETGTAHIVFCELSRLP
jgi:uncharacterized protein